jgi:GDP-4-dehydro-6-deoxy-D-mannose reductase
LDAKRDYTDVRDIARAYRLLLEKGSSGQIYNVCSGKALSGHEILDGLMRAAGSQPKTGQDPEKMRPADAAELCGSHDKLTAATGWRPEISLEQTLQDVVADWRSRN